MSDEDSSNSDDFGGMSGRDCHGRGSFEKGCKNCYDPDCPKSITNTRMSFDALVSELV